jgi:hypothetical protein
MANLRTEQKKFYSSKILKLTIYQLYTENIGFNLIKSNKPILLPNTDPNKLIIKLDKVNKDLTIRELQKYLNICLKSPDTKISGEASHFINKYQRLYMS